MKGKSSHKNLDEQAVVAAAQEMVHNQQAIKEMVEMLRPSSITDLAKKFKCSRQAINLILKKHGILTQSVKGHLGGLGKKKKA
jgi:Zn-dependent peptidase ImmA (M78 family)